MQTFDGIPLFWDAATLRVGGRVPSYAPWDYRRCPHMLIVGATGTGKTYAVKLILGRISKCIPDAEITICDYKYDDFRFLDGLPRYYHFDGCVRGINEFYEAFQARQRGDDTERSFRLLVFDEWASFVSMQEKKEAEESKRKLATLLMLGRSFNIHVLVSQQRADAAYFSTARDNFSIIIALGNLSRESRDMFFAGFKDEMKAVQRLGEGYLLANGAVLKHIQVPRINDESKLEMAIRQMVT